MNELKTTCLILNTIEDDFQTIWEIFSVLRNAYKDEKEEEIDVLFYNCLSIMFENGFIRCYIGRSFDGDEEEIDDFIITNEFISMHKEDWNNKIYNDVDYRFYITEQGREFLLDNCKKEFFQW